MSIVNKAAVAKTDTKKGLTIERIYTSAGVHPYDTVKWERRDVVQTNWKSGEVIFEQKGVDDFSFKIFYHYYRAKNWEKLFTINK